MIVHNILIKKHSNIPINVGNRIETMVHFQLLVSFFIVKQVVEQGKWHSVKMITHMAVVIVQPLLTKIIFKVYKFSYSIILPF